MRGTRTEIALTAPFSIAEALPLRRIAALRKRTAQPADRLAIALPGGAGAGKALGAARACHRRNVETAAGRAEHSGVSAAVAMHGTGSAHVGAARAVVAPEAAAALGDVIARLVELAATATLDALAARAARLTGTTRGAGERTAHAVGAALTIATGRLAGAGLAGRGAAAAHPL
jgi:hypothetical protein